MSKKSEKKAQEQDAQSAKSFLQETAGSQDAEKVEKPEVQDAQAQPKAASEKKSKEAVDLSQVPGKYRKFLKK